jgi:hypothetical protein
MFICEFCQKEYSTKSTLSLHQKTAKFCIKIQTDLNSYEEKKEEKYTCNTCKKEFTIKCNFLKHQEICNKRYNITSYSFQEEIKELHNKIEHYKNLFENCKSELEKKNKYFEEEFEKVKVKYNQVAETRSKLKSDPLEKEIKQYQAKNNELKEENNLLKRDIFHLQNQYNLLKEDKEKVEKKLNYQIISLTEKLALSTVNNNNTVINNTYNGIDFSQERFNKHVEDHYSYTRYEQGKEGAKTLFINFIYFDETIIAEVKDNSRNKIRVSDNKGNDKYITFKNLLNLCQGSTSLVDLLNKYGDEYHQRHHADDPHTISSDEINSRTRLFKEKGLKKIYSQLKEYINTLNESRCASLQNIDDEKKEEKTEVQLNYSSGPNECSSTNLPPVFTKFDPHISQSINRTSNGRIIGSLFTEETEQKAKEYRESHPFDESQWIQDSYQCIDYSDDEKV